MKKHKIVFGIELTLFIMIVGTIVSYAAGSNPPSEGVRYTNNGQATVQGALNDLYEKVGNSSSSSSCLPSRTASTETLSAGGSKTYSSGSYANGWTVSCANKTCPTCESQGYSKVKTETFACVKGSGYKTVTIGFKPKKLYIMHNSASEGTLSWLYDENISTTKYFRNAWKTFASENTDTGYALKITSNGFTLGHFNSNFTLRYVAIG